MKYKNIDFYISIAFKIERMYVLTWEKGKGYHGKI